MLTLLELSWENTSSIAEWLNAKTQTITVAFTKQHLNKDVDFYRKVLLTDEVNLIFLVLIDAVLY